MSTSKGKAPTNPVEIPLPSCYPHRHHFKTGILSRDVLVEGLKVIKKDWTKYDDKAIEEMDGDMQKILKYSRLITWSDVQFYIPPIPVEEGKDMNAPIEQGENTNIRVEEEKEPSAQQEKIVPQTVEESRVPPTESGPSSVPPVADKGKNPLEGEVVILPPQMFEGEPTVEVHTFGDPPTIECPLLEEFAAMLNETDIIRLARVERHQALSEKVVLEEKSQQVQAKEQELASMQTKYNELEEQLKGYANLHISKEELHKWCVAFMYRMLSTGGMAAAIKEVNLVATKCAKGPSEEEPIPDVPDDYMGIELEDADEEASQEDVADTGHSGVQKNAGETGCADIHSIETVAKLEVDLLDAMRAHNVRVNQHFINEIKELREEMRRLEFQKDKDFSDSLTFETKIHDELVALEKENTQLRKNHKITISPWFLEKHQLLARVQHMISIRTHRFIAAMDILKERSRETKLLMEYINELQNLLLDHHIDFQTFDKPEIAVDPRTQSSREEMLMRVHAQDEEIVDLKDKFNQCVNLFSQHGFKGTIHPSPDNPIREVLIIV
ncbi:OLC1v1015528C1 [Oldenlandia corymbosa var. corymbosa]|uniref:OLC1v1015528C1 n=1 Tax=Oldenlandia corymbosa var. corymbosa TaxID=529605 RepID=A0AAV1E3J1_OLDCO|nr:OLC1v1015528C1 [Oldenlandia corymbosa var. corymbosa]